MNRRLYKGHSLIKNLDNYTVLDIETTSLDSFNVEILEISAIKDLILDNLIDYFNLVKRNVHRALNDCILTDQVYLRLANMLERSK